MKSKLHGLETLRAYAIFSVLLFHYPLFFSHPGWLEAGFCKVGWSGVDPFFVLSGDRIHSQLLAEMDARKAVSLERFYIKRAFRILPPFEFVLALYVFLPWTRERESLPPLWKLLTFTQNIGPQRRQKRWQWRSRNARSISVSAARRLPCGSCPGEDTTGWIRSQTPNP